MVKMDNHISNNGCPFLLYILHLVSICELHRLFLLQSNISGIKINEHMI